MTHFRFTRDKHIVFGFHGYPWLIHRLTYRRVNRNLHVRGYKEEGTITTTFDICGSRMISIAFTWYRTSSIGFRT